MYEGSITIQLPAEVKEIERLNRVVRQFGELHEIPGRTLYAVNLALDEVVTNVVLYGFGEGNQDTVRIRMDVTLTELCCEVADGGRAFDPLQAPPPDLDASLQEREIGGLGIHLVRSLMDRLNYRREGDKNVLTMAKRIR